MKCSGSTTSKLRDLFRREHDVIHGVAADDDDGNPFDDSDDNDADNADSPKKKRKVPASPIGRIVPMKKGMRKGMR